MEIKGSIIVEKVDTCEEVVVPRVQGTIHPFSLSAIKSQASLSLSAALSQYTYFPWFIVSAFIDLSITRALKQISMARFFHPAGMWLTGHKNTTVLQPRRRGHKSASVGSRSTSSVTTIEPCLHRAYIALRCFNSFGESRRFHWMLTYNIHKDYGLYTVSNTKEPIFFIPLSVTITFQTFSTDNFLFFV